VKHAIAVNSGTDALVIGLRAMGVGRGDDVVTTPFTFFATSEAIDNVGARPVFVDVEEDSFNMNPSLVSEALTERTRALLPVHLFGHAADMDALLGIARSRDLKVLEDNAQAFGGELNDRKLGTIGHVGAFSFFPSKVLGAFGDGGLIVTDDEETAETARMLRVHGARQKYRNEAIGYNSRLDAIQAAILRVKLRRMDRWIEMRQAVAMRYNRLLGGVDGLVIPEVSPGIRQVWHQYTIRITDGRRDEVKTKLDERGISTMIYYPVPLHQLPVYKSEGLRFPVTEKLAGEVLSLPIWPYLKERAQDRVVTGIVNALR
jgi:dTDP-4-amino-4,6-dideoxygalactose transaminase